MPPLPSVAVVILNWNGKRFLEKFLPSVLATTYGNYKLVVADNGSADNSVSFLKETYPNIEMIRLPQNVGFAKGYNEALKQVSADYYVLLNSDVEVTPDWLHPMIQLLETDLQFGACQPKLLAFDHKNLFEYAGACGGWLDSYGYPFSRGRVFDACEQDKDQYNTVQQVFWASGAAMLIRSTVFHQLRGFDEFFFAHQEEIDLCWRMQLAGYKIFCCPQSVVYHVGGGTLPRGNSRKTFLNFRNNHIMLWKNLAADEKWWKVPFRLLLDWTSATKSLFTGDSGYFLAIIRAHLAFARWIFSHDKEELTQQRTKLNRLPGVYNGNIVWQHFVKGKKTFSEIVSN